LDRGRRADIQIGEVHRPQRGLAPRDFRKPGGDRLGARRLVGSRLDRIELDESVAARDMRPVPDIELEDLAGFERLDHLDAPLGLDLPLRHRMNVDKAEIRPGERDDGEGAERQEEGPACRRRRRLEDFERRRQELAIAVRA
jgi:hypothetical protein